MFRRGLVLALAAAVSTQVVDLQACGDKFLRAGRSARMKNYAAMYPATILLYPSPGAKPEVVADWQKILKQAGHKPRVIALGAEFTTAVAAGPYDIVITDYGNAARVKSELTTASSPAGVLPVLRESSKALTARATAEFMHVLDPSMTDRQMLAEIDHVMEVKLKSGPSARH